MDVPTYREQNISKHDIYIINYLLKKQILNSDSVLTYQNSATAPA